MTLKSTGSQLLGLALVVSLVAWPSLSRAAASNSGLAGTLTSATGRTPIAGAKVFAGDRGSGRVVASAPTDARGQFAIDSLAPGSYELAVESAGGLYVVATPVALVAGAPKELQIVVPEPSPRTQPGQYQLGDGALNLWSNPFTASLIVVGAAFVVGVVVENATDDDDQPDLSPN